MKLQFNLLYDVVNRTITITAVITGRIFVTLFLLLQAL